MDELLPVGADRMISRYVDLQLVTLVGIILVALVHVQSSQSTSAGRYALMLLYFVASSTAILLMGHEPPQVGNLCSAIIFAIDSLVRFVAAAAFFQLMGAYKLFGFFKWLG